MKNRWATIFFSLFFLFQVSFINANVQDGGEELVIIQSKTGVVICSFEIPKKYIGKDGKVLLPYDVIVNQDKQALNYSQEVSDTKIILPEITGSYLITFTIGEYVETCKVAK